MNLLKMIVIVFVMDWNLLIEDVVNGWWCDLDIGWLVDVFFYYICLGDGFVDIVEDLFYEVMLVSIYVVVCDVDMVDVMGVVIVCWFDGKVWVVVFDYFYVDEV